MGKNKILKSCLMGGIGVEPILVAHNNAAYPTSATPLVRLAPLTLYDCDSDFKSVAILYTTGYDRHTSGLAIGIRCGASRWFPNCLSTLLAACIGIRFRCCESARLGSSRY